MLGNVYPPQGPIQRKTPRLTIRVCGALWLVVCSGGGAVGCRDSVPSAIPSVDETPKNEQPTVVAAAKDSPLTSGPSDTISAFCGDCHDMPLPASFPKEAWRDEVIRGFAFYYASGRTDLTVPVVADVQRYFVDRAPERLELATPQPIDSQWRNQFAVRELSLPDIEAASISFIDSVDLGTPHGSGLLFSEMRSGGVYFLPFTGSETVADPIKLAQLKNPAAARVTDWDSDGHRDLIVADLGSFLPADHDQGRVVWFRHDSDNPGHYSEQVLQANIGRVSSLEICDLDNDQQEDILVAEFGWQNTGSLFALMRIGNEGALEKRSLDKRPGTIHLPTVDLNGDGSIDFVALVSQHYERVEAMINDGTGHFTGHTIFAAGDPSFGSSGIQLVDMNSDGRTDVLHTNGDSFDSFILKPFHGLRWLENQGDLGFKVHELGPLPGVHRAVAGDINGDGLTDIVAGAFLPRDLLISNRYDQAESLVLFLRQADGSYSRHVLAAGECRHAAIHLADVDGDGRLDIIAGNFREAGSPSGPAVSIWFNRVVLR